MGGWLRRELESEGLPKDQIEARRRNLRIGFEPADIINEVMSFGSGKPIEVAVSGPNFDDTRAYAARVREHLDDPDPARPGLCADAELPDRGSAVDRERAD